MQEKQLKDYCEAEFENIDRVLTELYKLTKSEKKDYSIADMAAISVFIHNFYNGIENILKRVLYFNEIRIKDSPTWHKDLLKISKDKNIISETLHNSLVNLLSFRHYFIHSYSFYLKWEDLKALTDTIEEIYNCFKKAIYEYLG